MQVEVAHGMPWLGFFAVHTRCFVEQVEVELVERHPEAIVFSRTHHVGIEHHIGLEHPLPRPLTALLALVVRTSKALC